MIWLTQAGIVVAGHDIGLIAHHMATARYENRFEIIISQLPIAIFMMIIPGLVYSCRAKELDKQSILWADCLYTYIL